jgi:hypothetical protein
MAGEVNGTTVIIEDSTGAIVGQGDFTHTYGGTLIETTNKSSGDNITYMSGENAGKQHIFAGQFTYNDNAQFRAIRAAVFAATPVTLTITYTSNASTDEAFSGSFFPTGLSDTIPQGVKMTTDISFNSSGPVTVTPAVT